MTTTQKAIRIDDAEAGGRLDRVLAAHVAELSRTRLKALIEAGSVAVDGRTIRDPSHRVNSGAAIVVDVPSRRRPSRRPKPFRSTSSTRTTTSSSSTSRKGLVVHPAAGHWTGTLVNALIAHCGDSLSGIGGERRPGIVHRLDKDTTGLMVVAKNDRAHRALAAQFAGHGRDGEPFERGYLAFVWGAPDRPRGTIDRPIDRHKVARDRMAIREGGREAVTHWQVLERYGAANGSVPGASEGGRPAAGGEPAGLPARNRPDPPDSGAFGLDRPSALLGDEVYGAGFRTKAALLPQPAQAALAALGRQALHAYILTIEHPITGEILRFRSELPPDLARLHDMLAAMRADSSDK